MKYRLKIRALTLAVLLGGLSLTGLPVKAHASPCQALLCMYGRLTGGGKQAACRPSIQQFFGIVIFTPFFNPILTAEARQQFLQKCTGAMMNEEWVNAIIATYGSLMTDPDPS